VTDGLDTVDTGGVPRVTVGSITVLRIVVPWGVAATKAPRDRRPMAFQDTDDAIAVNECVTLRRDSEDYCRKKRGREPAISFP
jgi:hypothetical protein